MGKVVKAIAMIAIAVAVAVAAPYIAPYLAAGLGSIGITVTTAVATGIAGALLSAAAALTLSAFVGKPATNASPTDIRQSLGSSQIVIGKCRVGAVLTFFYPKKAGSSHYRYFVWTVAGHRVNARTKWYLNDQETTVDSEESGGTIRSGPYKDHGNLWFDRGDYDTPAFSGFVAECDGRWTVAHQGRGIAKIYARFEMTDAIVQSGMPNITIEVEGTDEVYDPRTDTTGYSNNAALAFYWWMALPRAEGGFGCYDDEIDWDWVSAQANVCDEDVPVGATRSSMVAAAKQGADTVYIDATTGLAVGTRITIGSAGQLLDTKTVTSISGDAIGLDSGLPRAYASGTTVSWADPAGAVTEKRYALDGFLTTGADPSAVRDVLVANQAGRFTYSGGLMLMRPGYWTPVSQVLDEDDLIAGITYDLLTPGDQRVTAVVGTWNDPANLYQQVELPTRSIDDADTAQASVDLPFVKSHSRGERIQKIKLLQSGAEKTLQWPMNIAGLGIGPMETLRLDTQRYSLGNYAFCVTNWTLGQDFSITLTLREEYPEMYDWEPGDESSYAVIDRLPAAQTVDPAFDALTTTVDAIVAGTTPVGSAATADTAGSAASAGAVTDGTTTFDTAKLSALEARLDKLDGGS